MFDLSGSTFPAVRQWEEAGVLLSNSLDNYLRLCASLGKESLTDGAPRTYVAARIDTVLGSFHATLGQQLAQSQSALAQTRNQLLVPLHSFPEEVLSEIFMQVILICLDRFSRDTEGSYSMNGYLTDIHRTLKNLLGVCTMWRNIASNQGTLWSIVPLVRRFPWDYKSVLARVLHHNKGLGLNLIALTGSRTELSILANHIAQSCSITIVDTPDYATRDILKIFTDWRGQEPLRLSQLSLYNDTYPKHQAADYVFRDVSEKQSINRLVKSLALLQMKSVLLHWETLTFSDRLTTFHLQDVILGFDRKLVAFLDTISSATQLRELRIISVSTYTDSTLPHLIERSETRFLSLQTLFIGDLYFNTLRLFLSLIPLRPYRLSLVLTRKFTYRFSHRSPRYEQVKFDTLVELLKHVPVHNLGLNSPCLEAGQLKMLVRALAPLEAIRFQTWRLEGDHCLALRRSRQSPGSTFSNLVSLDIKCQELMDLRAFKSIIKSHSGTLERVSLSKPNCRPRFSETESEIELRRNVDALMDWIGETVPQFTRPTWRADFPLYGQILQEKWCLDDQTHVFTPGEML